MTAPSRALRLLGFLAAPVVAAVSPLMVLPSITRTHGADGWAVVAIALAVGGAGAVLAELGWGVVGPQRVGRAPEAARDLYAVSLATRLTAVAIVLPIAATVAALLVPTERTTAALVTGGVVLSALSPAWYLTGLGRPWTTLAVDALPRFGACLVAAAVLGSGAPLWTYGALLVAAAVVSFGLTGRLRTTVAWPARSGWSAVPSVVRGQVTLVVARGVSTTYTMLPAVLVSIVAPNAVPVFAAADRLVRMGLSVLAAVPSTLQRWIGHPDPVVRRHRAVRAIAANAALGVLSGLVVCCAAPVAVAIVFSGTVVLRFPLIVANGVLAALICTSRGTGLALVAADRASSITGAVLVAAVVGTVGTLFGSGIGGATGAVAALCVAEACGLVVQLVALGRPHASARARASEHQEVAA